MLCRGGVYTYYEVPGKPIKPEHWQRKMEYSLLKPPEWAYDYDLVQNGGAATTVVMPSSGKSITVGVPSAPAAVNRLQAVVPLLVTRRPRRFSTSKGCDFFEC